MARTRRPQGVDYKNEIYAVVFENPGIKILFFKIYMDGNMHIEE